jgi:hypothetical protein
MTPKVSWVDGSSSARPRRDLETSEVNIKEPQVLHGVTTGVSPWFGRGLRPANLARECDLRFDSIRIGLTPEVGGPSSRPNHGLTPVVTNLGFRSYGWSPTRFTTVIWRAAPSVLVAEFDRPMTNDQKRNAPGSCDSEAFPGQGAPNFVLRPEKA